MGEEKGREEEVGGEYGRRKGERRGSKRRVWEKKRGEKRK